jgi:hypothetical protein
MQPPMSSRDLQVILGDTKDKEYPIFRTPTHTDPIATLATGECTHSNAYSNSQSQHLSGQFYTSSYIIFNGLLAMNTAIAPSYEVAT